MSVTKPPDRRRTDTRARIRVTALELFTSQGYAATGLGQVAERLGITRPAVYHHFGSKEELLTDSYLGLRRALDDIAARAPDPTVPERLDALFAGEHGALLRCTQANEHALRDLPRTADLANDLDRFAAAIAPGDDVAGRMRGRLALATMTMVHVRSAELGGTLDERRAAAVILVRQLLDG